MLFEVVSRSLEHVTDVDSVAVSALNEATRATRASAPNAPFKLAATRWYLRT